MRQGTIVTVAPVGEPLTLEAAKRQLRIEPEDVDQDAHIGTLIAAARQKVENELGIPILRQTRQTHLFSFPCGAIWLGGGEAIDVQSIKYYDAAGVQQTMLTTDYVVDAVSRPATVMPAPSRAWPSTLCRAGSVQVEWQGGWATAADVPADLVHAMKLLVAHWDQNREAVNVGAVSAEVEQTFTALIDPYRIPFVA
ncbi:head-tail connector protein [Sphingopyxis indica]|uniref:head-tail connector protein n=1 Tax=Sphingopyxis indica TaxID=436663 RepID=UPI0029391CF7|nr:head-tail connector protein [Sphingopyxis indica]WOF43775.1 head-tail connector protein [Sphingopyxis indica]